MLETALAHPADMAVFDALRHLSTYLSEAHVAGKHHLADLYEIVQYAGNILPVSLPTKLRSLAAGLTSITSLPPPPATLPDDHRRLGLHVDPGRARQGDHEGHDGDDSRCSARYSRSLPPALP